MNLASYGDSLPTGYFKDVFTVLSKSVTSQGEDELVGDSFNGHSDEVIEIVKERTFDEVKRMHLRSGQGFITPQEAKEETRLIIGDSFYNTQTHVGTMVDPQTFTRASVPVMFGPSEASGVYASGGIAAVIVDKKARGMVASGVTFKTLHDDFWNVDKLKELEESAEVTGFNEQLIESIRDALLYGGTCLYPIFNNDTPASFERPMERLRLEKGCICRWLNVDRWNVVYVPSFIITAEDYLRPKTVYIPLGGYAVNTTRTCLMKPKSMPYWATMYNMGWSPSDLAGYIRALYGYQMVTMSVPIMAQQMSLLMYQIPMDSLQASLGPETVKKLMQVNEEQMREWSILNPKAVNMIGEIKIIERTFSGFEQFYGTVKSDLASQCGIAEPILFHTPNKGFSDNTQSALLKDSEMMKMLQRIMEQQLVPCSDALVAHTYGMNSEEWENRRQVYVSFDKPIVSTENELAEIGARYAATVSSLAQAGVPVSQAVLLAGKFFKGVQIEKDMMNEIKKYEDFNKKMEEKGAEKKTMGGGTGHSMASKGNAGNPGTNTRPK
jgi:hypothetical protein